MGRGTNKAGKLLTSSTPVRKQSSNLLLQVIKNPTEKNLALFQESSSGEEIKKNRSLILKAFLDKEYKEEPSPDERVLLEHALRGVEPADLIKELDKVIFTDKPGTLFNRRVLMPIYAKVARSETLSGGELEQINKYRQWQIDNLPNTHPDTVYNDLLAPVIKSVSGNHQMSGDPEKVFDLSGEDLDNYLSLEKKFFSKGVKIKVFTSARANFAESYLPTDLRKKANKHFYKTGSFTREKAREILFEGIAECLDMTLSSLDQQEKITFLHILNAKATGKKKVKKIPENNQDLFLQFLSSKDPERVDVFFTDLYKRSLSKSR